MDFDPEGADGIAIERERRRRMLIMGLCMFMFFFFQSMGGSSTKEQPKTQTPATVRTGSDFVDIDGSVSPKDSMFPLNMTGLFLGAWAIHSNQTLPATPLNISFLPNVPLPTAVPESFPAHGRLALRLITDVLSNGSPIQLVAGSLVLGESLSSTDAASMNVRGVYVQPEGAVTLFANAPQGRLRVSLNGTAAGRKLSLPATDSEDVEDPMHGRKLISVSKCVFRADLKVVDKPLPGMVDGPDQEAPLFVVGRIQGLNCDFDAVFSTAPVIIDFQRVTVKATIYSALVVVMTLIHTALLAHQIRHSSTHARQMNISVLFIASQVVHDLLVTVAHLVFALYLSPLFFQFIVAAGCQMIFWWGVEIRYLIVVWKAHRAEVLNAGTTSIGRELGMLYCGMFLAEIGCVYLVQLLVESGSAVLGVIFLFAAFSFWIPQIIANIKAGNSSGISPYYAIGLTAIRLFYPLYFLMCPVNWLAVLLGMNFTHFAVAGALLTFVLALLGVLLWQRVAGSRFFVPRRFLPESYDYHRPVPALDDADIEAGEGGAHECVICMSQIHAGVRREWMVTPCNHFYHERCLRRWMDVKMECPTCRAALPSLVE